MTTGKFRAGIAALVAAILLVPAGVSAQAPPHTVSVRPAQTSADDDPNRGGWFFLELSPGELGRDAARIRNDTRFPQRIKLYLRDLDFDQEGEAATIEGPQTDIGAWGAFDEPEVTVGPNSQVDAWFSITPPVGADPGDHVGAVVVESEPLEGQVRVISRIATRLYVTLPGDARRAFEIERFDWEYSAWWPREAAVTALLRNTGRVRVEPSVLIGNSPAKGPTVLLSRSAEQYLGEVRIPWYGGPVKVPVLAEDLRSGLTRRADSFRFVIPWGLLVLLALSAFTVWRVRRWWVRRAGRLSALQTDIRRLEALIAQRPGEPASATAPDQAEEEVAAILLAIKRARRAGAHESVERLALALHEATGDALGVLLESLKTAAPDRRAPLIEAVAGYGKVALTAHSQMGRLPPEVQKEILERLTGPKTKTAAKKAAKKPSKKAAPSGKGAGSKSPARAKRKSPSVKHKATRRTKRDQ